MGIAPIAICNQKPSHPKRENARERLLFVDDLVIGPLVMAYSIANGECCAWRQVPGLSSAAQSAFVYTVLGMASFTRASTWLLHRPEALSHRLEESRMIRPLRMKSRLWR